MIQQFLEDIGLSEKEAEIYQKLLTVESASVVDLSKLTLINRTTIYPVLEQLIKKDLVVEVDSGKKAKYQAEPPERLITFIKNKQNSLAEQEKLLDEVIPRLKGASIQTGEKPIVKIYEGREGILKSVGDYFQAGDKDKDAYLIYPRDIMKDVFSEKEQQAAKENRIKNSIKLTSIYSSKDEVYQSDNTSNRYRLDSKDHVVSCEIGLYADRLHIHTLSNSLSAIYIKSKDFADTMKTLFKLAIKGIEAEEKEKQNR